MPTKPYSEKEWIKYGKKKYGEGEYTDAQWRKWARGKVAAASKRAADLEVPEESSEDEVVLTKRPTTWRDVMTDTFLYHSFS